MFVNIGCEIFLCESTAKEFRTIASQYLNRNSVIIILGVFVQLENRKFLVRTTFGGTPVGTATMAATHEDNSSFSTESNQNIEAAREYSADRNNLPYILFGGAGLILFLLLLWRIIKVAKS